MKDVLQNIKETAKKRKLLAVLIDPDKMEVNALPKFIKKVNASIATHIFVGGSTVKDQVTQVFVKELKPLTSLPIVLFPGDVTQISKDANALLFLSLLSGDNPEYLIGKHVKAVSKLKEIDLEIIPTGYLLIEGGVETAVQRVTLTKPLPRGNTQLIIDTAKAGELLGMQLIYLEAGSGAKKAVPLEVIKSTKEVLSIPLIVGGGIRTKEQLKATYNAGADVVVIGTAFEEDEAFFEVLKA
ncbi:geranylgeranylglyceryl/heptaprenylglyceryl phosphate synthase [Pontimicrobium sp. MEBiC01747]